VTDPRAERHLWLVRHGETEWSANGRHTSRTDVPLTPAGREQARNLGRRLAGHRFALVLTSPRSRARETARLAGFPDAIVDGDLREWEYGAFEGLTTAQIRAELPDWTIWSGPWRDGETAADVSNRADRVIERCLDASVEGDALLISHGHFLRVLAARWLGLGAAGGRHFALATATIGVLGWERETRVIETWNEACRVEVGG
jgi:probable phosphoglycerate mutase